MNRRLLAFLVSVAVIGTVGCATFGRRYPVVDRSALNERIRRLYTAGQRRDWETWYSLVAPPLRESSSMEEFVAQTRTRNFEVASWAITRIRGERDYRGELAAHKDDKGGFDPTRVSSVVAVAMEVYLERGGKRELAKDQTDYWIRYGGTWFWLWRGWPSD